MSSLAVPRSMSRTDSNQFLRYVLIAGALVGALDAADNVVWYALTAGLNPVQVLQYVGSGLLGPAAFSGGLPAAAAGAGAHFAISFVVAALFGAAVLRLPVLRRPAAAWGLAYGMAVWTVMNLIVLPYLSRVPASPLTAAGVIHGLLGHAVTVGLTSALAARRLLKERVVDAHRKTTFHVGP